MTTNDIAKIQLFRIAATMPWAESETGFALGSIFGAIIDALAYYWLFKCIEII